MRVSYERKTRQAFFNSSLHQQNPSSAEDLPASPMKEKRAKRFSPFDLQEQIRAMRGLQRARQREVPRAGFARVSDYRHSMQSISRRCPHKESQSAFIPSISSGRMSYESLRTDKRKTPQRFSTLDLKNNSE